MEELKSLLIPLPAMKGDWRELFFVEETKISSAGVEELRRALPEREIIDESGTSWWS